MCELNPPECPLCGATMDKEIVWESECPECGAMMTKEIVCDFDPESSRGFDIFYVCPECGYEEET